MGTCFLELFSDLAKGEAIGVVGMVGAGGFVYSGVRLWDGEPSNRRFLLDEAGPVELTDGVLELTVAYIRLERVLGDA